MNAVKCHLSVVSCFVVLSGCSLAFGADRFEYGEDAGMDASAPDAGAPDAGSTDAGRDAGPGDGGQDAGPCGVACGGDTPLCDPTTGACVACRADLDCDDGDPCTLDRCGIDATCSSSVDTNCIAEVSAGSTHTCARRVSGRVLCWGDNSRGQLGNGTSGVGEAAPVAITSPTDFQQVSAGLHFTCAVRSGGTVRCWGDNSLGQLGDGTMMGSSTPAPVMGLSDATVVSVGLGLHACARRASGEVVCWGNNGGGQLGNGSGGSTSPTPVSATGLTDAIDVATGFAHSCAARADGTASCWGSNAVGQVGSSGAFVLTPREVVGLPPAAAVDVGLYFSCALLAGGDVVCWGENDMGQLGNGTMDNTSTPTAVSGLHDAVRVSMGERHACAVRSGGEVVCWGSNADGQLGDGSTVPSAVPITVSGLLAIDVSAGGSHTCARALSGGILCWGANSSGQLGDGTTTPSTVPRAVVGL